MKMKRLAILCSMICSIALLEASSAKGQEAATPSQPQKAQRGDSIFTVSFAGMKPEDLKKSWRPEGGGELLAKTTPEGLLFEIDDVSKQKSAKISRSIPIDKVRGATLKITARVRAEGVSKKPKPYNGIKLMLKLVTDTQSAYPQARPVPDGTFDWTDISFAVAVPQNAKSAALVLGLEQVSGKLWIESVNVVVAEEAAAESSKTAAAEGPAFRGHSLPRLRGFMVSQNATEDDLKALAVDWNANLIRWQLGGLKYKATGLSTSDFDKILDEEVAKLDALLPACRKYGILVVVDMHSLAMDTFTSKENQDRLVAAWRKLAQHYKGSPAVWGYDIVNEPRLSSWKEGCLLWNALAERVAQEIRKVDPDTPIIIEAECMALPNGFETLRPVSVPKVIYSVHMYNPGQFTHNRVYDKSQAPVKYPGVIDGVRWDKAELEKNLKPVIDFQKKYGAHIYVGEFSAIRWSPGAAQYLSDLIDIFESHGWDWSYHAFREFQGWSLEHGSDIANAERSAVSTDREKVVRSWLAKNTKPAL